MQKKPKTLIELLIRVIIPGSEICVSSRFGSESESKVFLPRKVFEKIEGKRVFINFCQKQPRARSWHSVDIWWGLNLKKELFGQGSIFNLSPLRSHQNFRFAFYVVLEMPKNANFIKIFPLQFLRSHWFVLIKLYSPLFSN